MHKPIFLIIYKKGLFFLLFALLLSIVLPITLIHASLTKKSYTGQSLSGKIIVVDPGHGGVDSGTHYGQKIFEKNINLQIALKLKEQLTARGASVILTRETDISLDDHQKNGSRHREDLNARVNTVNKNKADVFVSIHVNYIRSSPSTLGPMVFYYGTSKKSQRLAELIQESLNTLSGYDKVGKKAKHSASKGNYVILRETSPPGVIVETGFLSNAIDRTLLQKDKHQQEIAALITKGVVDFFLEQSIPNDEEDAGSNILTF